MGIKDKRTYGEHYWAMQVEAQVAFDEQIEQVTAPLFAGILGEIPDIPEIPASFRQVLSNLAEPPAGGMGGFALGVGVEMIDEVLHTAFAPIMKMMEREYNRRSRETWLTSAQANILFSRKKIPEDFWESIIASEGYEDVLGGMLYRAELPYPSIPDLVLYSRYHGDPDNVWGTLQDYYNIDPIDFKVWEWLGKQRLTTLQIQALYKRGLFTEQDFYHKVSEVGWYDIDRDLIRDLAYTLPNAMLTVQGNLMQGADTDRIIADITKADIHPDYAKLYLDAILTKPASIDLVNYMLRQDPELHQLPTELQKIGIHPDYTEVYKTLAYQIPPVADIITMAVREAFTPDIAERFGQYEDFPPALEQYAGMKGLTKEWSERYWAAHWSLPSPQQGFQLLHRGIINQDELSLLLRALDVMPFWRDKLIQMSYRLLTRVDIRRMYGKGVLTEEEVFESYSAAGYDEQNARRMTLFTVKQTLATQSKFTTRDVVTAYTKRLINRSDAASLLRMLDTRTEDIDYILSAADYKRQWELTEQQIRGIRNLYKRNVYDVNQARDKLSRLDLPSDQINVLMEQWLYETVEEGKPTWTTAQTLKFAKTKKITRERAIKELEIIGYDAEHIKVYMADIK